MLAIGSGAFLKEFTVYCDKVNDEKEALIVQRSNEKNVVVLSLEEYNNMKKQLFQAKRHRA